MQIMEFIKEKSKIVIPIVFSTDHTFVMPTLVAITSLLKASTDVICHIYILQSNNVTDEDREQLSNIVNKGDNQIYFISVNNDFDSCFQTRGVTVPTYFRLQIPWLLPQYDKIVYLDGDIIIKKSIKLLFDQDLKDNLIAGARIHDFMNLRTKQIIRSNGLDEKKYINAGILLINAKLHREMNLYDEYKKHLSIPYTYQDQDMINIVCKNKIKLLPEIFNYNPASLSSNINYQDMIIIHYAGAKPWKEITYYWMEWLEYFEMTSMFDKRIVNNAIFKTLNTKKSVVKIIVGKINSKFPLFKKVYYNIITKKLSQLAD